MRYPGIYPKLHNLIGQVAAKLHNLNEDAYQEAEIGLWKAGIPEDAEPTALIRTIIRNSIIDWIRKDYRSRWGIRQVEQEIQKRRK